MSARFEAYDATLTVDVTVIEDVDAYGYVLVNSPLWQGGARRVRASCVTPTGETVAERVSREWWDDYDRFERPKEMNE